LLEDYGTTFCVGDIEISHLKTISREQRKLDLDPLKEESSQLSPKGIINISSLDRGPQKQGVNVSYFHFMQESL